MTTLSDERKAKHEAVSAYLEQARLDGVLLGRRCNFSWYTCGGRNYVGTACDVGTSWLLVRPEGAAVLADNIEAARLGQEDLAGIDIELIEYPYFDASARRRAFARATAGLRIAADAETPGGDIAARLGRRFDQLRWRLGAAEIERYRLLCDDTAAAVEAAARAARAGDTENAIAARACHELRRRHCLAHLLLVGGDERARRFRHPLPTPAEVRRFFMLAACAERGGLIASCTRLVSFEPAARELVEKLSGAAIVAAALVAATRPGAAMGEMFAEAQAAYAAAGFPDAWRLHHQGGSCGYQGRDVKAAPGDRTVALADQAFAWNPSIAPAKIEQMVLCSDAGPQPLTAPTDWPTVPGRWRNLAIDLPTVLVV